VVRWGPNELSFACAEAWRDIYDRRKDGKVLVKDPLFYRTDDTVRAKHIVNTSDPHQHAQMRKMMVSRIPIWLQIALTEHSRMPFPPALFSTKKKSSNHMPTT